MSKKQQIEDDLIVLENRVLHLNNIYEASKEITKKAHGEYIDALIDLLEYKQNNNKNNER